MYQHITYYRSLRISIRDGILLPANREFGRIRPECNFFSYYMIILINELLRGQKGSNKDE